MRLHSVLAVLLLPPAIASGAAAGENAKNLAEIKRLLIDVEQIRRLEPAKQKLEVERLYRTLAPRIGEFRYHLRARLFDFTKDRDKLTAEAWVAKAWASSSDAYQYLLFDARATCYAILAKNRATLAPLIVADLAGNNEKDVNWALRVVAEVGGKEFFEPVLEVFEKNPANFVAIYALRRLEDPRAIAPMIKRHPDLVAVFEALRHLQSQRPADAALVALLESKDPQVRWRAAYALAESGDAALVGSIEKLLRDDHPDVRENAANMGFSLDKEAYGRIRPALVALMRDPHAGVKKSVLRWLADRRDPACGKTLLEMAGDPKLNENERHDVVRMIHALTQSSFGFEPITTRWRPDTPKNQQALRLFAEWLKKNGG